MGVYSRDFLFVSSLKASQSEALVIDTIIPQFICGIRLQQQTTIIFSYNSLHTVPSRRVPCYQTRTFGIMFDLYRRGVRVLFQQVWQLKYRCLPRGRRAFYQMLGGQGGFLFPHRSK